MRAFERKKNNTNDSIRATAITAQDRIWIETHYVGFRASQWASHTSNVFPVKLQQIGNRKFRKPSVKLFQNNLATSAESLNDVNNFDSEMNSTDGLLCSLTVAETDMVLQDITQFENQHQANICHKVTPLFRKPNTRKFTILEMKNRLFHVYIFLLLPMTRQTFDFDWQFILHC